MIRAVLFDVGGPLDLETKFEAAIDDDLRTGLQREGFEVDDAAWQAANRYAVESFAPNAYKAVLWRLTACDVSACERIWTWIEGRSGRRDFFELRPGISAVLLGLQQRGLKLGLVANQPTAVLSKLERAGIGKYFQNRGVSGVHGYRKPDVRLFMKACHELEVTPAECVMVGDRIDNDIAPAALLGMRTVLIRTGRHREQQPRSWQEQPDIEVDDAEGILRGVLQLAGLPYPFSE